MTRIGITTGAVLVFSVPELLGLLSVLMLTAGFAVAMCIVIVDESRR